MQREEIEQFSLQLKHLQVIKGAPPSKKSGKQMKTNRTLMKLYLSKQVLEQCLETFDLFKEILDDPIQKVKLVRDVMKNIQLKVYDEDAIVYNKGDLSHSIYLVIKGTVALCMPNIIEDENDELDPEKIVEYDYQEIDTFQEGVGFGQAQFIHGKKRGLVAKVKQDATVVGWIQASAFEEIIELYKQRVYYKKLQMFGNCPLLKQLTPYQLEFIVNNSKPVTYPISKEIVCEGQRPKALYLIKSGQLQLQRKQKTRGDNISKMNRKLSKQKLEMVNNSKIKIKHVVVGILDEGCYLGDGEIALQSPYTFSAVCKSEKVKAYICDMRIIESQMTAESTQLASKYYKLKNSYREKKESIYRDAKSRIQNGLDKNQGVVLSLSQKKIKRKIMSRYVEKYPTLVGQLSPQEISMSIERKYARIKTSSPENQLYTQETLVFPLDKSRSYIKKLVRNERTFSPILKRLQKNKRKYSEPSENFSSKPTQIREPIYEHFELPRIDETSPRSETRPLLVFMRPFHRKVETLHERLTKQYNITKLQKQKEFNRAHKIRKEHELSLGQMDRLCEFIGKIQKNQ